MSSDKHYTSNYLEETGNILNHVKELSYKPFLSLEHGTIIDLGCGTGIDVHKLATTLNDNIKIIGIDHDQHLLDNAINSSTKKSNTEFLLSNATDLPFENESIDGLRTERLIQHLSEPDTVFGEIHRILRKDSPVVIVETDWPSFTIFNELSEIDKKVNKYLTEEKVRNGYASRRIFNYLLNHKFRNISYDIFPFILRKYSDIVTYFMFDKILLEAYDKKYITSQEHSSFLNCIKDYDEKGLFASSINIIVSKAIK